MLKISLFLGLITILSPGAYGQEDKVLWLAALDGDVDTVKAAVNNGVTARLANENGLTLLHAAAMGGHLSLVKFLVENGAGVNRKKVKGETPLFISSANGRVDVVKYLLEQGATVDKPDDDKWTPLHIAAYHGHLGVVQLLVENGANVNSEVDEGATAVSFASQNGHTEVVEYLLEKGANPNNYDNVRRTPLHMAALNGHKAVAQVLLKAGARTNIRDGNGMTPKAAALSSFGGMWGMLAIGLFAEKDELEGFSKYSGLFHGGGFYLLGVQGLCCVCFIAWSSLLTFVLIKSIDKLIHFRMTESEELVGADYSEHNIFHPGVGVTRAVSVIKRYDKSVDLGLIPVGKNKGHMEFLEREYAARLEMAVQRHAMTSARHRRSNRVDHISLDNTKC